MSSYTLTRTGNRPLAFDGEAIAGATSRGSSGPAENRWHELAVYRTAGGALVLRLAYRTQWQGELAHDEAVQVASAEDAAAELRAYDPCAYLLGYPPGEHYAERQERVRRDLRLRYETAVSEVLGELEPERVA